MSSWRYKRVVIGLPQGLGNLSAAQAAVDFAEFLQLELLAAFITDAALFALADFPAVRELRIFDQQWQPLDVPRISRELEDAATIARKRFDESIASRTVKAAFDVLSGVEAIPALLRAGDIVAIVEPSHPGESITRQFTALVDAAFETAAAILIVPRRVARTSGPILALASSTDDASIRVALQIAAAAKERLIVVAPAGALLPPEITAEAERLGVSVEQLAASETEAFAPTPLLMSSQSRERLRVISRQLLDGAPRLFSMLHGVPLLAVESEHTALAEAGQTRRSQSEDRE
jgi:hypothetical protein